MVRSFHTARLSMQVPTISLARSQEWVRSRLTDSLALSGRYRQTRLALSADAIEHLARSDISVPSHNRTRSACIGAIVSHGSLGLRSGTMVRSLIADSLTFTGALSSYGSLLLLGCAQVAARSVPTVLSTWVTRSAIMVRTVTTTPSNALAHSHEDGSFWSSGALCLGGLAPMTMVPSYPLARSFSSARLYLRDSILRFGALY